MYEFSNRIKYYQEKFPEEELQEIIDNKEEMISILLDIMKDVRDNHEKYLGSKWFIHLYATYLLAQFRVKDFYEIIMDIARLPDQTPFDLYGDTITEALGRIIASVYNGDLNLIYELIEDTDLDEYVRGQGIGALEILVFEGILEREKVVDYLKKRLVEKIKEKDYEIITDIVNGLTNLYPKEAMDEIKLAYEKNMVYERMINLQDVQGTLDMGEESAIEYQKKDRYSQLIGNIKDEMGWWHCFNKDENKMRVKKVKIGRNAPCPCGSGKKYKKCCGRNA